MASQFSAYAILNADLREADIPPVSGVWDRQLVRFALSFDGYEFIAIRPGENAVVKLAALARPVAAAFVSGGALPSGLTLSELRACLFWEQRRSRNSEAGVISLAYIRALLDAIQAGCATDKYYHRESPPFVLDGVSQFVEVIDDRQTVRRCRWPSREVIEEIVIPLTHAGCHISEFNVSGSGAWITTERISGQGEWGYDILRTDPLTRVGGVAQARGFISEAPRFAADESCVAVFASRWQHWLSKEPRLRGYVNVGWLYLYRLPGLEETDHEVVVHLLDDWEPEVEYHRWGLPKQVTPMGEGVRLVPSGGLPVEVVGPLPEVIVLPTPHPSGQGFPTL